MTICKVCKHNFLVTSILKHIKHAKSKCKAGYTKDELKMVRFSSYYDKARSTKRHLKRNENYQMKKKEIAKKYDSAKMKIKYLKEKKQLNEYIKRTSKGEDEGEEEEEEKEDCYKKK